MKAVQYYGYCRLTHGFLRGLCYEGCNDGFGVGVWIRGIFNFDKVSVALKTQILAFTSRRVAKLERELFEEIQKRIKKQKRQGLVPALLAIGILVDQLDCNIHEGTWLSKPGKNLVVRSQSNCIFVFYLLTRHVVSPKDASTYELQDGRPRPITNRASLGTCPACCSFL